ncbi:MAG: Z1 domain-containing protein, partial [Colwellia sp.]
DLGTPISYEFIETKVVESLKQIKTQVKTFEIVEEDIELLKFHLASMFSVKIGEEAITLGNPDAERWFDNRKSEIKWRHWDAYREMLLSQARAIDVIDANERVIDAVLDYSADPTKPGKWSRKGLVMGNVQSGKTQNYLGLINKAIDCGYKVIILLGGHLNDLRKQTQERVDEGVLGLESRHLIEARIAKAEPIGVGCFDIDNVNTGTTTLSDFSKHSANSLGFKLNGKEPVIFTIKKHTGVMKSLYEWIKKYHFLNPENGKKLDVPLLLIDDEADYASINTKHHKEEVTATNGYIRKLLSLFNRNTYVGYTATPFANIFIDPDDNAYSNDDDLFPSDFMIKIPVPDNYMGQEFFFGKDTVEEGSKLPVVIIDDHASVFELKKHEEISAMPGSLKQAIRAFIIVISVRNIRGEKNSHNTMLVNISHLKTHQDRLEFLIEGYVKEIYEALDSFSGFGFEDARNSIVLRELEKTYKDIFDIKEDYKKIFSKLRDSSGKIKTWAINQGNRK